MRPPNDWIQTYTGKKFWPLDPKPEEVDIRDIAHALSLLCRFGGHCYRFYSVAEHSMLVSRHSGAHALWGLLHDASEAYLIDVPRPLKRGLVGYREAEAKLQGVICEAFGLPVEQPDEVSRADVALLMDERLQIMAPAPEPWSSDTDPLGAALSCHTPRIAEALFMEAFEALTAARKTSP
ncbi:hypothetical protein [Bradyrhizobium liaoningense]|uniref:hypothetical protein n=1 Tax=Bradyrhizobium liaoningense TaxID=43992 RepID=UPI0004B66CBE|nr:hypothetical protein [Bradyrhizobium liaoningense]